MSNENYKIGQLITYEKEIMFKGVVVLKSKIVAITEKFILLESGDKFYNLNY